MFKPFLALMSLALIVLFIKACANNSTVTKTTDDAKKSQPLYPLMSAKECSDVGGELVGDIGDGRIHKADYLCNNGTAPIGTIYTQDEPVMTEGAVCCGP